MINKRLFGAVYDRFIYSIENVHRNSKRARLPPGKVLEIGVGTGTNFEH